jgi:hypothetical protein
MKKDCPFSMTFTRKKYHPFWNRVAGPCHECNWDDEEIQVQRKRQRFNELDDNIAIDYQQGTLTCNAVATTTTTTTSTIHEENVLSDQEYNILLDAIAMSPDDDNGENSPHTSEESSEMEEISIKNDGIGTIVGIIHRTANITAIESELELVAKQLEQISIDKVHTHINGNINVTFGNHNTPEDEVGEVLEVNNEIHCHSMYADLQNGSLSTSQGNMVFEVEKVAKVKNMTLEPAGTGLLHAKTAAVVQNFHMHSKTEHKSVKFQGIHASRFVCYGEVTVFGENGDVNVHAECPDGEVIVEKTQTGVTLKISDKHTPLPKPFGFFPEHCFCIDDCGEEVELNEIYGFSS